ncbi:MULE domain-containing protein [Aphis craccivora]|uniref:MULE domain-containing protein n=1 Tax=Aphis craccivora TaxID=307492 RepID=A0A6G0W1W1_APHCR|nr:MULE domain-containing protein [Aphis craccivora]
MESTYCRLFEALKSMKPKLNPDTIMIDFEKAVMSAILKTFPVTKIRGCFFHFTQSVWRHVQQAGLHLLFK